MGNLVWIASYPKSGNTWMRFFLYAYFSLEQREIDRIDVNAAEFGKMFIIDIDRRWFETFLDKPWEEATAEEVARARIKANAAMAAGRRGLVLAKTHHALVNEFGAPTINSAATYKAIYIVRNPLDVVPSARNHFKLDTISKAVARLNNHEYALPKTDRQAQWVIRSWRRNVETWTTPPRNGILTVRYEDMLRKPYHVFASVVEFLGQKVERERILEAMELTKFERMRESELKNGFKAMGEIPENFFRAGKAGKWRDELSEQDVRDVVAENSDLMRRHGYLTKDLLKYVNPAT